MIKKKRNGTTNSVDKNTRSRIACVPELCNDFKIMMEVIKPVEDFVALKEKLFQVKDYARK